MARERVDVVEAHVGPVGEHRRPVRARRAGRRALTISSKFSAPSALVSTKKPVPRRPTWCSTWYSWPCVRGSTTRGTAAGSSASTSRTSVVIFDADVTSRTRPVRARPTDTKNRSSSSWNTSASSSAGVPTRVAPDLPRPHRVVGPREEHRAVVVRPGDAVVDVGHHVVEIGCPSRASRNAQVVALAAGGVGGVRGEGLVGVEREVADREVVVAAGELVLVEHDGLTGCGPRRRLRIGKTGRADDAPAVHVVLQPFDGAGEVLESPRRTGADTSVSCTRCHDLLEQALAQRCGVARATPRCTRSRLRGRRAPRGRRARAARTTGRHARRRSGAGWWGAEARPEGWEGLVISGDSRRRTAGSAEYHRLAMEPAATPIAPPTTPIAATDEELRRSSTTPNGLVAAIVQEVGTERGAHARLDERRGAAPHARDRAHVVLEPEPPGVLVQGRDLGRPPVGARGRATTATSTSLLFLVEQEGRGACHTGEHSCFFRAFGSGATPGPV